VAILKEADAGMKCYVLRAELTSYATAELASGDFRLMAGLIS
jgi:hypothetical protein